MNELMKNVITILIALPLIMSLLNSNYFGYATLTSFFGTSFFSSIAMVLLPLFSSKSVKGKDFFFNSHKTTLPLILVLAIFSLQILMGYHVTLTYLYWAILILFFIFLLNLSYISNIQIRCRYYKIVLGIAIVECIIVFLQYVHLVPSQNHYFKCTGTWVNPNVTALFLSMCLFAISELTKTNKAVYSFAPIIILSIIMLKCRSASIVSALWLCGILWKSQDFHNDKRWNLSKKWYLAMVIVFFLVGTFVLLTYFIKVDSTKGRLLIWKNCISFIQQRFWSGYGLGSFEKEYNLFVFANNLRSIDHVNMPYNDYIELLVENGILCLVLWLVFLTSIVITFIKNKIDLFPIVSFIIIGAINFTMQAPPLFSFFLVTIAFCLNSERTPFKGEGKKKKLDGKNSSLCLRLVISLSASFLVFRVATLGMSYHKLSTIDVSGNPMKIKEAMDKLQPELNHTDFFWSKNGAFYKLKKDYFNAKNMFLKSLCYSSNPSLINSCGECYDKMSMFDSAKYYYQLYVVK